MGSWQVVPRITALALDAGTSRPVLVDVTGGGALAELVSLVAAADPPAEWIVVPDATRAVGPGSPELFAAAVRPPVDTPAGIYVVIFTVRTADDVMRVLATAPPVAVTVRPSPGWTVSAPAEVAVEWDEWTGVPLHVTGPPGARVRMAVEPLPDPVAAPEKFEMDLRVEDSVRVLPATGAALFTARLLVSSRACPFTAVLYDDQTGAVRARSASVTVIVPGTRPAEFPPK